MMSFAALAKSLLSLSERFYEDRQKYEGEFPHVTPGDARLSAFVRCRATLNSTSILAILLAESVPMEEWWRRHSPSRGLTSEDREVHLENLEVFLSVGLTQNFFSMLETTFRVLLRTLDPAASNRATGEFKNVYEALFSRTSRKSTDAGSLLDLLRCIRNTVHNNGIYFHKSWTSHSVKYKGRTFQFEIGKQITFFSFDLLFQLFDDCRSLLNEVLRDPKISAIARIEDFAIP